MDEQLSGILAHFSLQARVFQAGLLCQSASFDAAEGLGYIHVLRAGKLTIKNAGAKTIQLNEPSLLLHMKPTSHQLKPLSSGAELVCASFDFGKGMMNPLAKSLPNATVLKLNDAPSLNASLQLLFSEAEDKSLGLQSLLNRLMEVVIIQLIRELIEQKHLKIGILAGLADPKLSKAIVALHAEPARQWTLDELANIAGLSRTIFSNTFRETVGDTPGHYLSEWRIGIAQSLLRKGKSLQLIADAIGYANTSALSRAFIAMTGLPPKRWKKQHD